MSKNKVHTNRIYEELINAGMSRYGFMKNATSKLPQIIHENEHIGGVVFGRSFLQKGGTAMLVATDKRIIYINSRPMASEIDEIAYFVVSGVKQETSGPFASITLHTKIRDIPLKYVNLKCARTFIEFIEKHIEEEERPKSTMESDLIKPVIVDKAKTEAFIHMDDTAILSTVTPDDKPYASIIHYIVDHDDNFYFLTKDGTTKSKNLKSNQHAMITIHNSHSLKILQAVGEAEAVNDPETYQYVFENIAIMRDYTEGSRIAPISKIDAGAYVVYKIIPKKVDLTDYSTGAW